jgi:hypothetical protein
MTELYPCRCGGKATLETGPDGDTAYVKCAKCGTCSGDIDISVEWCAKDQAIELWNKIMKPDPAQPTHLSDYSKEALLTELKSRENVRAAVLTGGQRLDPDFEVLFIGLDRPEKEESQCSN